ncbi:hypothetical protein T4E_1626 [Trichinella pseudospiralis]|uniref:Uncharacterized protein n=1 Tax=Trichinella pseudospiralis TaxID=6337 RepID=A0A0V0XGH2_TRIPS|nr:hypothetical protein T4E_1626 [Trichinella pseudospiralis]
MDNTNNKQFKQQLRCVLVFYFSLLCALYAATFPTDFRFKLNGKWTNLLLFFQCIQSYIKT